MAAAPCVDLEKAYKHNLLVNELHNEIGEEKTKEIRQLLRSVLKKNLDAADMRTMLNDLTDTGMIKVGEYSYLTRLLTDIGLERLVDTVKTSEKEIQCLMDDNMVAEDENTVQQDAQENGERSKRKRTDTLDTSSERCAELQLELQLLATKGVLQIAERALTGEVLQNPRKRKRIFDDLLQFKAELVGPIRTGSILLTVRFYSLADLTYFWSKYKDGTVTAALSDILLSDKILEVSREHHVEFYITCDISEDAYIEARRKLSSDDEVPGAMDAMARVSISDDTQGQEVIQEESLHEQVVSEAKEGEAEASGVDFAEEAGTRTPSSSEHMQDRPLRDVKRTRSFTMATSLGLPSEIPRNERENYVRMRLLLERATDVLRDVLRTQLQAAYPGLFDPSKTDKLFDVLDNQQVKHSLLKLKKTKIINSSQMKLLYPSGTPSKIVTTQALDITLVVVLLRNITNLNRHAKWESPPASDTSIEANIGRVRTYRNRLSHGHRLGITDTAFQAEFNDLKHVLLSLSSIYTSDDYDKLLIVPLDAEGN
ncbi:uncharacterized protein LOC106176808 [Lingula anatina]|uniref:Uncharacterized protein LOC106176808 n=1 Tax=Lingula anatina TaxID=7574 RepID=A0A1S3JXL5_LINAN|nr:uncharacterized protein LOC106176808 [Lingula anatina]|eukprot:XP_013414794.1 uncharacterized protein LOC106176808 [Lingula anatina]